MNISIIVISCPFSPIHGHIWKTITPCRLPIVRYIPSIQSNLYFAALLSLDRMRGFPIEINQKSDLYRIGMLPTKGGEYSRQQKSLKRRGQQ